MQPILLLYIISGIKIILIGAFHFFNDNEQYLQVDKVSHIYGAYVGGKMSMQLWKWAGVPKKKYVWVGGLTGLAYETVIEIMDGFSDKWGFSIGDYAANVLGTSILFSTTEGAGSLLFELLPQLVAVNIPNPNNRETTIPDFFIAISFWSNFVNRIIYSTC